MEHSTSTTTPDESPREPLAHDSPLRDSSSSAPSSPAPSYEPPSHAGPPPRTYYVVYAALLVLLVLTVGIAQLPLGFFGIILAMIIAVVKAVLVLLYFMHLRYTSRLTWLFAGAGFVWLMILIVILMADYLSRGWT